MGPPKIENGELVVDYLSPIIQDLSDRLDEYFGALNEYIMGARSSPSDLPPKPPELILYEQTTRMGVQVCAGGIIDQPYIWMEQWAVCDIKSRVWEATKPKPRSDDASKNHSRNQPAYF